MVHDFWRGKIKKTNSISQGVFYQNLSNPLIEQSFYQNFNICFDSIIQNIETRPSRGEKQIIL